MLHNELKKKAFNFLKSINCNEVVQEFPLKGVIWKEDRIGRKSSVILDVYAPDKSIAVECGGSNSKRLDAIISVIKTLYILPYSLLGIFSLDNILQLG